MIGAALSRICPFQSVAGPVGGRKHAPPSRAGLSRLGSLLQRLSLLVLALGISSAPAMAERQAGALTSDEAIARAVNEASVRPEGVDLVHPRYAASFFPDHWAIQARRGGPLWRWRLKGVSGIDTEEEALCRECPVRPSLEGDFVVYPRGRLTERYRIGPNSVEQQFLLQAPPAAGRDLVIEGSIECDGAFERLDGGWRWRDRGGYVRLGEVTVLDAVGRRIDATFEVTASATRIQVDGAQLAVAAYPVLVDPEVGANDFQISQSAIVLADPARDAFDPDALYDPVHDRFVVVWSEDRDGDEGFEIVTRSIDGSTGERLCCRMQVSEQGPDGDTAYGTFAPAIALAPGQDRFFIVWHGDEGDDALLDDEFEVYGRFLYNSAEGKGLYPSFRPFRISRTGADGDLASIARRPDVTYNPREKHFLVVWEAVTAEGSQIRGRRYDLKPGDPVDAESFAVSGAGAEAARPTAIFNPTAGEYLVTWSGDRSALPSGEFEILGQRIAGDTGLEVGADDFPISDAGNPGDAARDALSPDVSYNPDDDEYLVVWSANDTADAADFEVFGQRLSGSEAGEVGGNDVQISEMGSAGKAGFGAWKPRVAYSPAAGEYCVAWIGDDDKSGADDEMELFARRVSASGKLLGSQARISDAGPGFDPRFDVLDGIVAASKAGNWLFAWNSDDDEAPLTDDHVQVFNTLFSPALVRLVGNRLVSEAGLGVIGGGIGSPDAAYGRAAREYLVAWPGSKKDAPDQGAIYVQRIDAVTAREVGPDDLRISSQGHARANAVAYNAGTDTYLVAWNSGNKIYARLLDGTGTPVSGEIAICEPAANIDVVANPESKEFLVTYSIPRVYPRDDSEGIHGQRVDALTGAEIGADDFRIGLAGPPGDADAWIRNFISAYNSADNQYFVAWTTQMGVDGSEIDVFGQFLDAKGAEIGGDDFAVSDYGPRGDGRFTARLQTLAYDSRRNRYLVTWEAENPDGRTVQGRSFDAQGGIVQTVELPIVTTSLPRGPEDSIYLADLDQFVFTWWNYMPANEFGSPDQEIYIGRYAASTLTPVEPEAVVTDLEPPYSHNQAPHWPRLAGDGSAAFLVTFTGSDAEGFFDLGGYGQEVFGQILSFAPTGLRGDLNRNGQSDRRAPHDEQSLFFWISQPLTGRDR